MNTVSGKCSPKVNVFQKLVFFLGPSTTRCEYTRGVNKKAANVHGARLCVSRSQPKLHFDPSVHTKKCNFLAGPLGSTVSGKRSPKVNVFQKRSSWASFLENVHSECTRARLTTASPRRAPHSPSLRLAQTHSSNSLSPLLEAAPPPPPAWAVLPRSACSLFIQRPA